MQHQFSVEFMNVVSSYTISVSSIIALALTFVVQNHNKYWKYVYLAGILVGFSSAYYHLTDLSFGGYILDISSIALMLTMSVYALLRDYRIRYQPLTASMILLNFNILVWAVVSGPVELNSQFLSLARYSDFSLILNGLIFARVIFLGWDQFTLNSRRMVLVLALTFTVAFSFWLPQDKEVGFGFLLYHSAWHITVAMGIFLFWAFNQMRYEEETIRMLIGRKI
jgi:hypothetical protein